MESDKELTHIIMSTEEYHPQFLTATIYRWHHALKSIKAKQIILNSL